MKINHGVYIDVFPLDFYPEHFTKSFRIRDFLLKARISAEYDIEFSAKMIILQRLLKVVYPDINKAVRKRNELMQSIPSSSIIANICGAWGAREIAPEEWFGEGRDIAFEDITAKVPRNYHEYLTKLYGDYMTPPPIEKRVGHHYTEIVDLEKSYIEYI